MSTLLMITSRGACDFALYQVSYREGTEISQRIPNHDFSQGLKDWGLWSQYGRLQRSNPGTWPDVESDNDRHADGRTQLCALRRNCRRGLHGRIKRSCGSLFDRKRILCDAFFLVILRISGVTVRRFPWRAAAQTYSTLTDRDGSFHLRLSGLAPGHLTIQGKYGGDDGHWSTYSRVEQ